MEDAQIVALFHRRDQQAIGEAEQKYGSRLISLANRVLSSREDSRECVNDALYAAWQTIPPNAPENLFAYLCRLTRCAAIDCWRRRNSARRAGSEYVLCLDELADCVGSGESPENQVRAGELTACIAAWLRAQPEQTRAAFALRYYHMLPLDRIAERFGCSTGKIKSILYRARQSLRRHLKKEGWIE